MLDQIPTPPAHTVPDLRVGMLVTVHDAADVDCLRGCTLSLVRSPPLFGREEVKPGDRVRLTSVADGGQWVSAQRDVPGVDWCVVERGSVFRVETLPHGETVDAGERSEFSRFRAAVRDYFGNGELRSRSPVDVDACAEHPPHKNAVKVTSLETRVSYTSNAMRELPSDRLQRFADMLRHSGDVLAAREKLHLVDTFRMEVDGVEVPFTAGSSVRLRGTPMRASEAAGLFPGMTVHVETREDVEALVGRLVKLQGSPGDHEVTGFDSYTCEGHERRLLVTKHGGPIMLPQVFTVRDRSASERAASVSVPMRAGVGTDTTRSRCSDCNDTGILPGFGFGTSINACDRPCSCDAGKRKSEGEGPSEWTVVKREVRRDEAMMGDGSYSAEHVTVQRGQQVVTFRVVAHHDGTFNETDVICPRGSGWGRTALSIRGEACIDMAVARLLVGLREGTVQP